MNITNHHPLSTVAPNVLITEFTTLRNDIDIEKTEIWLRIILIMKKL